MAQHFETQPPSPPDTTLSILQKLIIIYKLWHGYWSHFDKLTRYSLGSSIDKQFIETIQNIFIASSKTGDRKGIYLAKASDEFDMLKFFLQIAWEIGALDDKKYVAISKYLIEIGKMLGGWIKQTNASR